MDTPSSPAQTLERFQPLRRAEKILLDSYRSGAIARVGLRRPLVPSAEVTIRGEFVSFLARGGDGPSADERRLQMLGAWIEGRIDLRDAVVAESLWFYRCVFDSTPRLDGARIGGSVSFRDCLLPGLRAEACQFGEELALDAGCTIRTEVRLARATIAGDLNCERLRLRSSERSDAPSRRRLVADGARIDGDAILAGGFESDGNVRLVGVRIAGKLRVDNARMSGNLDDLGGRGDALNLDRARIAGGVSLDQGFAAAGPVRLTRARIEGDLDCTGATFDVFGDVAWAGGASLLLDRAKVSGSLILARLKNPLVAASLAETRVGALMDDASTWGERLVLDGFSYARFADGASASAPFRLSWLAGQEPAHLDRDFRPGPWRQLIAVLRRTGHEHGARKVAVEREQHLRRIGRVGAGAPRALRWLPRLGHSLFGAFAGYGYRPARLIAAMALAWLGCGALYWAAAEHGAMVPTDPLVYDNPRHARCRPDATVNAAAGHASPEAGNWTQCPELAAEYPAFRPFAYSLDVVLPFADLQQERRWAPVDAAQGAALDRGSRAVDAWGVGARFVAWFETLFGWLASLTFAAALAGLFNRDRQR